MAISDSKRYTFHGTSIGGGDTVTLQDQEGEVHYFSVFDVASNRDLMDSLSPRANFLIGICWEEARVARDFELVPKIETSTQ
jgi:hypothetical protein